MCAPESSVRVDDATAMKHEIKFLRRELETCSNQIAAIRTCLSEFGLLDSERFEAHMHRHHFDAMKAKYGASFDATFMDAVLLCEVVCPLGVFLGPGALELLSGLSRATHALVKKVLALVEQECPWHLYICGGGDLSDPLRTVERFNLSTHTWEAVPPMRAARWSAACGALCGQLYVCGGGDSPNHAMRSCERFDPMSNKWELIAPMTVHRYWGAAIVCSRKLYVCGGEDNMERVLRSAERYDASTGSWELVSDMFEQRSTFGGSRIGTVIYVCGGLDEEERSLNTVERFDPMVGMWGAVSPMLQPRASATTTTVHGKLWVCGGKSAVHRRLSSAECLDPRTGSWDMLTPMLTTRAGAGAVGFRGRVYVFGGYDGEKALRSGEMFEPSDGLWIPLPAMEHPRWGSTAAILIHS